MKSIKLKALVLVTTVALASLATVAQPLVVPASETIYPAIPVIPPYIDMSDSFQVYAITAP